MSLIEKNEDLVNDDEMIEVLNNAKTILEFEKESKVSIGKDTKKIAGERIGISISVISSNFRIRKLFSN